MIKTPNAIVSKALKRLHYPLDTVLTCVRWYVAYPLSLRHLEEMMSERAVSVDHSTVHRWAIKLLPAHGKAFGPRQAGQGCGQALFRKSNRWKRRTGDSDDRQERGESRRAKCDQC